MMLKSVQQIKHFRPLAILVAACWHLCLTVLILPTHAVVHSSDFHCAVAESSQVEPADSKISGQHHADECQLCKLGNQIQPASTDTPGLPVNSITKTTAPIETVFVDSQTSNQFSGRAPPSGNLTMPTIA